VGHGYRVSYRSFRHRRLGDLSVPHGIFFDSLEDFLPWIGKRKEHEQFVSLSDRILSQEPALLNFLIRHSSLVLERAEVWERLLTVCRFFRDHPRPNLYIRQLDIPGVDTKFIEAHRALLSDLLVETLPPEAQKNGVQGLSGHGFERRFGLKFEPPLIRFRLCGPGPSFSPTDITTPLPEFESLSLPVDRVFLVENKINGLSFPSCPKTLVVFGLGYGVSALAPVPWFKGVDLFYWGDIDTHGFSILDRLRAGLPRVRSFLMDEDTLRLCQTLWVQEDLLQRFAGSLTHLTLKEQNLFDSLRDNRWGTGVRLEQERIPFGHVEREVKKLCSSPTVGRGRNE
jgi:hypothetical protein